MKSKPHIPADDLWAAYRGLNMNGRTDRELSELVAIYSQAEYRAGAVICEAARQAITLHQAIRDKNDYRSDHSLTQKG